MTDAASTKAKDAPRKVLSRQVQRAYGPDLVETCTKTDMKRKRKILDLPPGFSDARHLGRGAFGEVCSAARGRSQQNCEERVAVKQMPLKKSPKSAYHYVACVREVRILRAIAPHAESASIVKLEDVFAATDPDGDELLSLHLVMPCMDTDLAGLMKSLSRGFLTWERSEWSGYTRLIAYELFRALHFVHACNVIHRDVKPSNVLLNVCCGRPFSVALGDFGMARIVDDDYSHDGHLTDEVVTRWYRPPEVLNGSRSYSRAVDIWSAGCVLAEMLLGGESVLFRGMNDSDQLTRIVQVLGSNGAQSMTVGGAKRRGSEQSCDGRSWKSVFPADADGKGKRKGACVDL